MRVPQGIAVNTGSITDVFKNKIFVPLSEEQLAALTDEQLAAYSGLAAAVDNLAAADTEFENAVTAHRAAGEALSAARAVEKASPKWSRLDEVRSMIAQKRPDTLKNVAPLTVVDPSIAAAVIRAVAAQGDCERRVAAAQDRRRVCNSRVNVAQGRWQDATRQTISQEQLVRSHLASEIELQKDRAEGRVPGRAVPHLGSAIDAFAYYTKAHGRGTGGGRSFARPSARGVQGSFGPHMRGYTIPKG